MGLFFINKKHFVLIYFNWSRVARVLRVYDVLHRYCRLPLRFRFTTYQSGRVREPRIRGTDSDSIIQSGSEKREKL